MPRRLRRGQQYDADDTPRPRALHIRVALPRHIVSHCYSAKNTFFYHHLWFLPAANCVPSKYLLPITQLKSAEENLHYYLQEITRAQEEERKRISRELHDSTAQNLVALSRQLENYLNEREELRAKDSEPLWSYYQQIKDIVLGIT